MAESFLVLPVTMVIEYQGKFLMTRRSPEEEHFPGLWHFPGGKAEQGENLVGTIRREVAEETGLEIMDEAAFIDTYYFKDRIGVAFLVRATGNDVKICEDASDYCWISGMEELKQMECIGGVWKHLARALEILDKNVFDSLDRIDLNSGYYSREKL